MGKGCLTAVKNVNEVLGPALLGMDPTDQQKVDEAMFALDGTPNKANVGANAVLGISSPPPRPAPAPRACPSTSTTRISGNTSMAIGCEVFHNLKSVIKKKFGGDATLIGDEGGFAPPCDVESGLAMLMEAIENAGHLGKCTVGLDVASSEFKVDGENAYDLDFKTSGPDKDASLKLSGDELLAMYAKISADYPIVTIEDPFDQDDWDNWTKITAALGDKVQIVGDDLTVTNPAKIAEAIEKKSCNCLLLKVNQIGSISESIQAVIDSKRAGWGVMTSHRSGETEDDYIADLAVGLCTGEIKTGAPCRGERTAKYNQLLRIEETDSPNAGAGFRTPDWMRAAKNTRAAVPQAPRPSPARL
ncbi:phosphopyruvate hydratase [Aureococcus anophagefferens]|nr:phosphopyruvate hydratase [Aureococcus anophagefferens]